MKPLLALIIALPALAQSNLNEVPTPLQVPAISPGEPAAGQRSSQTTRGWESTSVHHLLYLPTDWKPDQRYPVIVEYAGNGPYANKLGDTSDGTVEGAVMGYGLSQGRGYVWLALPFIESIDRKPQNALKWWGDIAETKRYCHTTIEQTIARYGGDAQRVVLCGFSRGAIACNYLGLHDDRIASLWRGIFAHSHFEGSFKHPASDEAQWPQRLARLGQRSLWISHEQSTAKVEAVIAAAPNISFHPLPYPNHSVRWLLTDLPLAKQARDWLRLVARVRP
jgi:hypothetical protein